MQGSSEFIQRPSRRIHPWMLREVHVSTAGSLWGMLPFKRMKYEWVSKLLEPYKTSGFLLEIDQFGLVGGSGGTHFEIHSYCNTNFSIFTAPSLSSEHNRCCCWHSSPVPAIQLQVWGDFFYTLGPAPNHDMFDFLHSLFFLNAPPMIHEKHPTKKKNDTWKKQNMAFFFGKKAVELPKLQFARYNKLYTKNPEKNLRNSFKTVLQFLTLHGFFHGLALAQGWLFFARIAHRGTSISEIPVEPGDAHDLFNKWFL